MLFVGARQLRAGQLVQGRYTVAIVGFEPAALRLHVMNPFHYSTVPPYLVVICSEKPVMAYKIVIAFGMVS